MRLAVCRFFQNDILLVYNMLRRKSKAIRGEARGLMIADRTLRRAKQALGIEVRKLGFQGKFVWAWPGLEDA
jgi:hypothetical protein